MILAIIFRGHLANQSAGRRCVCGRWGGLLPVRGLPVPEPRLAADHALEVGLSDRHLVVLVPVFLVIFWRRRVNGWTLAGVAAAFLGLYLLAVPAAAGLGRNQSGRRADARLRHLFRVSNHHLGRTTQKHAFAQIVVVEIATCGRIDAALGAAAGTGSHGVVGNGAVGAGDYHLVSTCMGFAVQSWAQQFTPPTHTALIFSLEPVFAWITSYVLLDERLGLRAASGAALIVAGVLISELLGKVRRPQAELAEEVR